MTDDVDKQAAELRKAFESYATKITTAMGVGVEAACLFVEGEAKKKTPIDTGLLRNSITHATTEQGDKAIGYVGTNVEYAPFQEFGTKKMKPQPFLTPAVNENRTKIRDIIKRYIARALK